MRAGRPTGLLSLAVVLVVAIGIWLYSGGDPGSGTGQSGGLGGSGGTAVPTYRVDAGHDPRTGLPLVALADLPPEAADTVRLIDDHGPFPYDKDGATFGNYEALLPDEPHGYYQEFTVTTPGEGDRGARRIIFGQDGELYWTADHYASFSVIRR